MMTTHAGLLMLALSQLGGNQLNTFENFLQTAVSGIQGSGVIAGMMNVAYVIMLVGFLWEVYQSALHGGDVKGLGKSMVKYLATALVVQAWPTVFVDVNHAFVNAGSWMTTQGGAANVLDTWMSNLKDQFNQQGFQHTWNLIAGEMAGLIDAILIFIAYLLYPIVTVIFGFFYLMMGSVLYIAGPLVISLLPLGATNRLAKAYIENVFIWNAWPLLYGALGLLISAVHLDNMQHILSSQGFLGALNGMEGSFLVGLISIVYSVAIATIPFMAKSIVNGDVGSVARQMLAAATTAVAAGTAAVAGASAGVAAAKGGASAASGAPALAGNAAGGGGNPGGGGNQPASPQPPAQQTAAPQAAAQQPAAAQPAAAQPAAGGTPPAQAATTAAPAANGNASGGGKQLPSPTDAPATQGSTQTGSRQTVSTQSASAGDAPPEAAGTDSADVGTDSGAPAEAPENASENTAPGQEASPAEMAAQANTRAAAADAQGLKSISDSASEGAGLPSRPTKTMIGEGSGTSATADGNSAAGNVSRESQGPTQGTAAQTPGNSAKGSPRVNTSESARSSYAPNARYGLASWGAYHAARIAAHGAVAAGGSIASGAASVSGAVKDPGAAGKSLGSAAGSAVGGVIRGARDASNVVAKGASAAAHPMASAQKAAQGVANSVKEAGSGVASGFREGFHAALEGPKPEEVSSHSPYL
jgi:type IV secretory pathway TrbL component